VERAQGRELRLAGGAVRGDGRVPVGRGDGELGATMSEANEMDEMDEAAELLKQSEEINGRIMAIRRKQASTKWAGWVGKCFKDAERGERFERVIGIELLKSLEPEMSQEELRELLIKMGELPSRTVTGVIEKVQDTTTLFLDE
jgi:hypothetical protein